MPGFYLQRQLFNFFLVNILPFAFIENVEQEKGISIHALR
jgi:hypothetical protein